MDNKQAMAYIRVSGAGQLSGDGPERQTLKIKSFSDFAAYTCHEYVEQVTGENDEAQRPVFQQMIVDARATGVKVIIVENLTRLARALRIQESLIIFIASKGLTLIAADTGEDITAAYMGDPMRRALVQMQGVFAELEKNNLVLKLRGARKRKRDGDPLKGIAPQRCEGRKPFGVTPAEQETIKYIRMLADNGIKVPAIVESLNKQITQFSTRTGKPWYAPGVWRILNAHS